MSAFVDRAQKVTFYYGNAMVDLAHLLPADEAPPRQASAASVPASGHDNMDQLLSTLESHLNELMSHRRDLEFLLKDLKRLLPS